MEAAGVGLGVADFGDTAGGSAVGEGAMIGASLKKVVGAPGYNHVRVTMMAPGAEEHLIAVAGARNAA